MANLTNSNKLIWKFAQIESDISDIKESLPADWVGEWVITLWINDEWIGDFNVNQKTNKSINFIINRNTVWLWNVNNTSDMDKPVSTAQQAALDLKADKSELASVYKYKGSVPTYNDLPSSDQTVWDVYNVEDTWKNYAWDWTKWDDLGGIIDLSNYYNKTEVDNLLDQKADASDIPTVNDWTLDIQLNWTSVETFSANSANNKTANIEVTKSTVWLWNVDNTSDADKPISTATQAALDLKADKTELPTVNDARITVQKNSVSVDSFTLNQNTDNTINITVDKTDVGLGNVDNTSDADKPISTATQAALDLKADKTELPTVNDASVTVKQWTATKWTFTLNQAGDVTIQLDEWSEWDIKYSDFEFSMIAQSPDWEAIVGQMLSWLLNINRDITLLPHDDLKAWMQYLVRVTNTDTSDHDIIFYSESYTVEAWETKSFVFLATDVSTLELQECSWWGGWQTPNNWALTIADKWWNTLWTFTADQASNTSIVVGNMSYEDFNSVNDTTSSNIPLQLTGEVTPTQNFTLQAWVYKEWMTYVMRIYSWANPYTMSLWNGLTNPFNVDLTLTPDWVDQFVFLAINNTFELQPQLLTRADVEQILRDYNLIP